MCNAIFIYEYDNETLLTVWSFRKSFNDNTAVSVWWDKTKTVDSIAIWRTLSDGSTMDVCKLPIDANITPQNIAKKFPTLMLFQ